MTYDYQNYFVQPNQPPAPPKKINWAIIISVITVVVAVVVTLIVVLPQRQVESPSSPAPVVSEEPPSPEPTEPTFLDGHRTVATLKGASNGGGVMGATDDMLLVYTMGDMAHPVAIDRETGASLWETAGSCDIVAGAALACVFYGAEYGMEDSIDWVNIKTGQTEGQLNIGQLGSNLYDYVVTSQGVLVIAGQEGLFGDGGEEVAAKVGFFKGPGDPVWLMSVKLRARFSDWPSHKPFDEAEGLFAWHVMSSTFIFDSETGNLLFQAATFADAQFLSVHLICFGYDPLGRLVKERTITAPSGQLFTVRNCDNESSQMLSFSAATHPDVLFTSGEMGTVAYDMKAIDTWQPMWQSPGQDSSKAWPVIGTITWDGKDTAFAAAWDGQIWAFDIYTGEELWWSHYKMESKDLYFVNISCSDELLLISVATNDFDYSDTLLRADNGQPMTDLEIAEAFQVELRDGVLTQAHGDKLTVTVPAFPS